MEAVKFFILILGVTMSGALMGQIAEEIVTESSQPEEVEEVLITPLDGIVEKRIMLERIVLPYEPMREADLFWEKRIWRVLDIREKINRPFSYPDAPFFEILVTAVENGDVTSYMDEKFTEPLTMEELNGMLFSIDTTFVTNPDTYEDEMTIVKNEINYEDIKRFRIKEIWFFDEESSTLKVRILGIAPVKDVYDDNTGEFLFEQPMFW
ncbi:MAG: gliding motility protein GldN, partial [Saprospiraceae bacterium]|nr:gliding motility protein GldN [Saprospiraceae bacterium]